LIFSFFQINNKSDARFCSSFSRMSTLWSWKPRLPRWRRWIHICIVLCNRAFFLMLHTGFSLCFPPALSFSDSLCVSPFLVLSLFFHIYAVSCNLTFFLMLPTGIPFQLSISLSFSDFLCLSYLLTCFFHICTVSCNRTFFLMLSISFSLSLSVSLCLSFSDAAHQLLSLCIALSLSISPVLRLSVFLSLCVSLLFFSHLQIFTSSNESCHKHG